MISSIFWFQVAGPGFSSVGFGVLGFGFRMQGFGFKVEFRLTWGSGLVAFGFR